MMVAGVRAQSWAVGMALLGVLDAASGQVPAKPQPEPSKPAPARVTEILLSHDEASSRAVFAAVDRDADDRLNIFEFANSQEEPAAADPRDTTVFRRFDTDRDGFLSWPEFDARIQAAITASGEFRYRPCRVVTRIKPAAQPPLRAPGAKEALDSDVQGLLTLVDTDRSGKLSRDEFATLLSSSGLPAAAFAQFVQADHDGDRELDRNEIGTLWTLLPNLPRGPQVHPSAKSFSVEWRRADADGDGEVSAIELETVLRAHDLHLGRWSDKIIADADRSGDRRLGPAEVAAAGKDAGVEAKPDAGAKAKR